jgi:hypothetical protein
MKRRVALLVVAILGIGLLVPSVCGAVPEVSTMTFSQRSADGSFYSEGADGAYESVSIWANVGRSVETIAGVENRHGREQFGVFSYDAYAPASGEETATLVSVQVKEPMPFTCQRDLMAASLVEPEATADISIWYGEMPWEGEGEMPPDEVRTASVSITASWVGYGPTLRERSFERTRSAGFLEIRRSSSLRRAAEAQLRVVDADGKVWFDGALEGAGISKTAGTSVMKGSPEQ